MGVSDRSGGNATISGPEYTSDAGSELLMTSHMAQPVTAPANPIPLGQATGLEAKRPTAAGGMQGDGRTAEFSVDGPLAATVRHKHSDA